MGCRANVIIKEYNDGQVCLYTHWGGESILHDVARALALGRDRWDDSAYLARIIFCQMMKKFPNPLDETTGFGISSYAFNADEGQGDVIIDINDKTIEYSHGCKSDFNTFVNTFDRKEG